MWSTLLFVVLPYVCLAVFVVGHVWRWRHDQFGWTTRTSQILERKWLMWGSPLFHFGALFAIIGHAAGLLIPQSWTRSLGISDNTYHTVAVIGGVFAGVLLCAGLVILMARRFITSQRIKAVTTPWDRVLYVLLAVEIGIGMWQTLIMNIMGDGYEYRGTVSVWFRHLFTLNPDPALVSEAPAVFGWHVVIACLIIAIWPFTRLVHVWSVPLGYLTRPYVVYRRRNAGAGRAGLSPAPATPVPGPAPVTGPAASGNEPVNDEHREVELTGEPVR